MRHRILILFALITLVFCAQTAFAQNTIYRIVITNITPNQIISPPVVVTRSARTYIFRAGREASPELAAMAEDADITGLLDALAADPDVFDFVAADAPLPPG